MLLNDVIGLPGKLARGVDAESEGAFAADDWHLAFLLQGNSR